MPEGDLVVPSQIRQNQLVDQIGAQLVEVAGERWSMLIFEHRNLVEFFTGRLQVHRPSGVREYARPPQAVILLTEELREVMYHPPMGTWFSARWSITSVGPTTTGSAAEISTRVVFNYDQEPVWSWPAHPGLYGLDLEKFPRDEEHVPRWLREKVNSARRSL